MLMILLVPNELMYGAKMGFLFCLSCWSNKIFQHLIDYNVYSEIVCSLFRVMMSSSFLATECKLTNILAGCFNI